jgi:hypothetical protein
MTSTTKQTTSIIVDQDDSISSQSQHPSKLLIRTYNDDGSTKSILIDDSMSIRDVLFVLVHKNHREPDIDYALVEILPDLHMGNSLFSKIYLFHVYDIFLKNVLLKIIKN